MKPTSTEDGLDTLVDFAIEDIISTSSELLLAETAEEYGDRNALATAFDQIVDPIRSSFGDVADTETSFVSMSELIRFLTSGYDLSLAQTRALATNPRLRKMFQVLKAQLSCWQLPAVTAAASDRVIQQRGFDGGDMRLAPSGIEGQVYLTISLNENPTSSFRLIVETSEGYIHRINLPAPDPKGEIFLVLDLSDERVASLVAALRDPKTSGIFVKAQYSE